MTPRPIRAYFLSVFAQIKPFQKIQSFLYCVQKPITLYKQEEQVRLANKNLFKMEKTEFRTLILKSKLEAHL